MSDQKIYITSSPYTENEWRILTSSIKKEKRIWVDLDTSCSSLLSTYEKQQLDNIIATARKDTTGNKSEPFDEAEFERILNGDQAPGGENYNDSTI